MKTTFSAILALCIIAAAAGAQDLQLSSAGKTIASGGDWAIPMNSSSSKVALFSEQREPFALRNTGSAPARITGITIQTTGDLRPEELTVQNAEVRPGPLAFPLTIAPGDSLDFYVRFYPVQSGPRSGLLRVQTATGVALEATLTGQGRDQAFFSDTVQVRTHRLFGGTDTDEMITGAVADAGGNLYFYGQVTGAADRFAYDLFYGKVNADGSLAWAKLWNGPYRDAARDPGQNDETGGSADAIKLGPDGALYLTASTSPSSHNNNFAALVLKVDPATGDPVWEKLWRPDWPTSFLAKHNAQAYALDVAGGRVHVVGTTGAGVQNSEAVVFVLTLSAADGSVVSQVYADPTPGSNDRAYCVRADGAGNLYVGGLAARESLLLKVGDVGSAAPSLLWSKVLATGWGSSLNSLDVDPEGNLYATVDRRGATTHFSFLKLAADGGLQWGRTYEGGNNKNNNAAVVRVIDGQVFVGGRTGQSWYDAQMGDALLLRATADGALDWSAFHYSGKGPDELAEHRVKAIAPAPGGLLAVAQVYTGNNNGSRYWGYWYEGTAALSDYRPESKDLGTLPLAPIPTGEVRDASGSRKLIDLVGQMRWQPPAERSDGSPPDGELIYWRLDMPR